MGGEEKERIICGRGVQQEKVNTYSICGREVDRRKGSLSIQEGWRGESAAFCGRGVERRKRGLICGRGVKRRKCRLISRRRVERRQ